MKLLLVLLLMTASTLSGQTTLKGTIADQATNQPLHFATVAVVGQPYGTLSQADGSFALSFPDTPGVPVKIQVSFLGYATKEYTVAELRKKGKILLSNEAVDLPVASVSAADSGPLTEINLGRKEKKAHAFYQNTFDQTYQLATRISNPGMHPGVISEVRYYFGRAAKKGKPVRLNFYAVDSSCDCPGEALHATSIIPEKTKKGWNKLDLTAYQVILPAEDFFLAFEWLGLSGLNPTNLNFSVGIIPDRTAAPLFDKVGGAPWQEAVKRGPYRPLVRLVGKVE